VDHELRFSTLTTCYK